MKRYRIVLLVFIVMMVAAPAIADEFYLSAGQSSVRAGYEHERMVGYGFFRFGVSGIYENNDDNDETFWWGAAKVGVGNDTWVEGLKCEVGIRGIGGHAERRALEANIAATGFYGAALYTTPYGLLPVQLEGFGDVTYAPEVLSYADLKTFTEYTVGVGIRIIENASLRLSYTYYNLEMQDGPGDWSISDGRLMAGIYFQF